MQKTRFALYALLSGAGWVWTQWEPVSPLFTQAGLGVLFLIGAIFEARVATHRLLVLPPAVFMAYSFLNNMVGGLWYFATNQKAVAQFAVEDASILRGSWYTLVAVQVLWLGFHALPERRVAVPGAAQPGRIPLLLIQGLVGISLFAFVTAVQMNAFGYAADPTKVTYLSYLRFGINLGWLAIILIAVYEYEDPGRRRLLHLLLAGYFLMGLLYGSKSMAVMPVLLTIVALYASGRKVGRKYVIVAAIGISLAYAVIEPFRVYFETAGAGQETKTVKELAGMYVAAQDVAQDMEGSHTAAFLERMSYAIPLAKTLEFADGTGYHHTEEWRLLAFSPLYGVIPRLVWPSKPEAKFGAWASVHIFGLEDTTHTGITPQGYAYLVARLPGVILFFLLFGLIQRMVFNLLYLNRAFLPFFLLVFFDVGYPVSPWTFVAGNLQSLLLMSPLLFLVTRLRPRVEAA